MIKAKVRATALPTAAGPAAIHAPSTTPHPATMGYCTIGLVIGAPSASSATPSSTCLVSYPENPSREAQSALVLNHLPPVLPGQSVLLQFIACDLTRPVVLGVLAGQSAPETGGSLTSPSSHVPAPTVRVQLQNQETLDLLATKRLVLRCGKASITLQEDGTIEIRGTDVISRASGQNAVRGASITLN